jgi:hypothetical protein
VRSLEIRIKSEKETEDEVVLEKRKWNQDKSELRNRR